MDKQTVPGDASTNLNSATMSEEQYEDSASLDAASEEDVHDHFSGPPRQASVILSDGRRVRRSVTMTSMNSTYRRSHDIEAGSSLIVPTRSSLWRFFSQVFSPVRFFLNILTAPGNRGLVKCVIAYFIGSLVVFIPQVSDFIGHGDGKHFVATCTVYFHPSRSRGSMIQATFYAFAALAWAVFVSASSMATAIGFNKFKQRAVGHAVVLVIWLCGGVGFIGYWKQRMGDPIVGVASSMASMMIFFNITREGSLQLGEFNLRRTLQYFFIVLIGLAISIVVNGVLWPVSARRNLLTDMSQSTSQFSHFLSLVTKRFLQQQKSDALERDFSEAVATNQAVFASLQKNLKEAQYEYYLIGRQTEFVILAKITRSMENLAQHLNGLKSGCDAQLNLMSECSSWYKDGIVGPTVETISRDQSTISFNPDRDQRAVDMVRTFIYHLGPPMKSLAFTTKQTLQQMPFSEDNRVHVHAQLFVNLDCALNLYDEAREAALKDMYSHHVFSANRGVDEMADQEEVAASVDYFSFSLQEFVCETQELMYCLKELEVYQASSQRRSWSFLKIWRIVPNVTQHQAASKASKSKLDRTDLQRHGWYVGIKYRLWKTLRTFKKTEIRFAVKVGVGASLLALPAMVDSMRPVFVEWRMEWALLSFFVILNASVGGTYSAASGRVLGSALGAGLAMLNWTLFPGNRYALAPLGAIIAAPCMWMIINPTKANPQLGRFILLSYNLTALYAYSISQGVLDDDDDEGGLRPIITLIALHRIVSVTIGCLWGALINTYVWPIKARVELREGLSKLWLRIGWRWRHDPFIKFDDFAVNKPGSNSSDLVVDDTLELQATLSSLKTLLSVSHNEPRLRGKFPVESYKKLIDLTQNIIDSTYALNSALKKTRHLDTQELELLSRSRKQRRELGDLIFLYFYLLASAMRICLPLPSRFPSVTAARDRLLAKISTIRTEFEASGTFRGEDYSASFIYSLMTGQIRTDLDALVVIVTDLFGKVDAFDMEIED